jgi:creatinine amidohydrolase
MLLQLATWEEVDAYLERSRGIIIPIGSTEQHGPLGLIGTDAICPEVIARGVSERIDALVAPTISIGMAQHHLGFAGSISLRPSTLIAVVRDVVQSLARQPGLRCKLSNWYMTPGVKKLSAKLYGSSEGSHATPSEVSLTYFAYPEARKSATQNPTIAPTGPILDADDYRRRFPDGRIGADSSLASVEAGEKLYQAAVEDIARDYEDFVNA